MEFKIHRTSGEYFSKTKPTEKAYKKDGDKFPFWYINISTIEELAELVQIEGELVFQDDEIEIYDDYRE